MFSFPVEIKDEKDRILYFTMEKFLKDGFAKTTMDDIAVELHISKKTIYKYFSSKDELIDKVLENIRFMFGRRFDEIVKSDLSAVEKLNEIGFFFTDIAMKIGFSWLEDLRRYSWERWQKIEDYRTKLITKNFNIIIDQGKKEGLIIDKPNVILMTLILTSIQSIINPEFVVQNNITPIQGASVILEVVLGGMLTKKGRKLFKQIKSDS